MMRGGLVSPKRRSREGGFTLIELLVVITIIIVLAGIGLATYGNSLTRSKEAALKQDLFAMRDAIDQYYADKNQYPGSLQDLVTEKYIRIVPVDPFTGSAETWQTVMAEPDARNPTAQIGVYDVKSGATQSGFDGTAYAEW